jgi:hypothetical protein
MKVEIFLELRNGYKKYNYKDFENAVDLRMRRETMAGSW